MVASSFSLSPPSVPFPNALYPSSSLQLGPHSSLPLPPADLPPVAHPPPPVAAPSQTDWRAVRASVVRCPEEAEDAPVWCTALLEGLQARHAPLDDGEPDPAPASGEAQPTAVAVTCAGSTGFFKRLLVETATGRHRLAQAWRSEKKGDHVYPLAARLMRSNPEASQPYDPKFPVLVLPYRNEDGKPQAYPTLRPLLIKYAEQQAQAELITSAAPRSPNPHPAHRTPVSTLAAISFPSCLRRDRQVGGWRLVL